MVWRVGCFQGKDLGLSCMVENPRTVSYLDIEISKIALHLFLSSPRPVLKQSGPRGAGVKFCDLLYSIKYLNQ